MALEGRPLASRMELGEPSSPHKHCDVARQYTSKELGEAALPREDEEVRSPCSPWVVKNTFLVFMEKEAAEPADCQTPRRRRHSAPPGTRAKGSRKDPLPWNGGVVTVMVRQVPRRLSQVDFLEAVEQEGFKGLMTFFYLPADFKTYDNFGYGFISFSEARYADEFRLKFEGKYLTESMKLKGTPLHVHPASVQGYEANYRRFVQTKKGQTRSAQFSPFVFTNNGEAQVCFGHDEPPSRSIAGTPGSSGEGGDGGVCPQTPHKISIADCVDAHCGGTAQKPEPHSISKQQRAPLSLRLNEAVFAQADAADRSTPTKGYDYSRRGAKGPALRANDRGIGVKYNPDCGRQTCGSLDIGKSAMTEGRSAGVGAGGANVAVSRPQRPQRDPQGRPHGRAMRPAWPSSFTGHAAAPVTTAPENPHWQQGPWLRA